jgi:hypothetical protein
MVFTKQAAYGLIYESILEFQHRKGQLPEALLLGVEVYLAIKLEIEQDGSSAFFKRTDLEMRGGQLKINGLPAFINPNREEMHSIQCLTSDIDLFIG